MGSAHPLNAPYEAFQASDGWLNLGAANQTNWERTLAVIGAPELNDDERFSSNKARMENREALTATLAPYFKADTTERWIARLQEVGVPAGPVLSIAEMHGHEQTIAREMVVATLHPVAGEVKAIRLPVKCHGTPGSVKVCAPRLGEHTHEVLVEAGYTQTEIDAMIASGAAAAASGI